MRTTRWTDGVTLKIDPNAVEDFVLDWSAWLGAETIAGAVALPALCQAVVQSSVGGLVTVRVSAALPGAKATCRVTTNTGRVDDRTLSFEVLER